MSGDERNSSEQKERVHSDNTVDYKCTQHINSTLGYVGAQIGGFNCVATYLARQDRPEQLTYHSKAERGGNCEGEPFKSEEQNESPGHQDGTNEDAGACY